MAVLDSWGIRAAVIAAKISAIGAATPALAVDFNAFVVASDLYRCHLIAEAAQDQEQSNRFFAAYDRTMDYSLEKARSQIEPTSIEDDRKKVAALTDAEREEFQSSRCADALEQANGFGQ